jgi:hypothetical protein
VWNQPLGGVQENHENQSSHEIRRLFSEKLSFAPLSHEETMNARRLFPLSFDEVLHCTGLIFSQQKKHIGEDLEGPDELSSAIQDDSCTSNKIREALDEFCRCAGDEQTRVMLHRAFDNLFIEGPLKHDLRHLHPSASGGTDASYLKKHREASDILWDNDAACSEGSPILGVVGRRVPVETLPHKLGDSDASCAKLAVLGESTVSKRSASAMFLDSLAELLDFPRYVMTSKGVCRSTAAVAQSRLCLTTGRAPALVVRERKKLEKMMNEYGVADAVECELVKISERSKRESRKVDRLRLAAIRARNMEIVRHHPKTRAGTIENDIVSAVAGYVTANDPSSRRTAAHKIKRLITEAERKSPFCERGAVLGVYSLEVHSGFCAPFRCELEAVFSFQDLLLVLEDVIPKMPPNRHITDIFVDVGGGLLFPLGCIDELPSHARIRVMIS